MYTISAAFATIYYHKNSTKKSGKIASRHEKNIYSGGQQQGGEQNVRNETDPPGDIGAEPMGGEGIERPSPVQSAKGKEVENGIERADGAKIVEKRGLPKLPRRRGKKAAAPAGQRPLKGAHGVPKIGKPP